MENGRDDLAQLWLFLQLSTAISSFGESQRWKVQLFDDIINYLDIIDDFQMISVMMSIFMAPDSNCKRSIKTNEIPTKYSNANTKPSRLKSRMKQSSLLDEKALSNAIHTVQERVRYVLSPNILQCISQYTDYLYNLGHFTQRCELLKNISLSFPSSAIRVNSESQNSFCTCLEDSECEKCGTKRGKCPLCRLPMNHLFTFCNHCGHGGHIACMKMWTSRFTGCPLGCECECALRY